MTAEDLKRCYSLKSNINKLKKFMIELPKLKSKYTKMEYRTREEFYRFTYDDYLQLFKEIKKRLKLTEKIKLVLYNENKKI